MMNKLRFLQALALVSVSASGCATRTIDQATGPSGTCVDKAQSKLLGCAQGSYCTHDGTNLDCRAVLDAGNPALTTCGIISCDTNHCTCSATQANTCECIGAVIGPLFPPELPA
ncbi:MAG: hypothetical protein ACXWUG_05320 [Polyangiales bacterium]